MLIRIESPYFVVGVVTEMGVVKRAAPIVKYMIGWKIYKVIDYCKYKLWEHKESNENTETFYEMV